MARCPECRENLTADGIGHARDCSRRRGRIRLTPSDAQELREERRRQEIAQREREAERRRQIVARTSAALLGAAPTTSSSRSSLDDVAYNVHNAYDWQGRGDQCVTAVVRKSNGRHVVFAQRFMNAMEEYGTRHYADHDLTFKPGGGSHLHAEMYAVLHYLLRGKHPGREIERIGVSKPICPLCRAVLTYLGIRFSESWVTAEASSHWIDPWSLLPATCKPPVKHWRKDEDPDDGVGGGGGSSFSSPITV